MFFFLLFLIWNQEDEEEPAQPLLPIIPTAAEAIVTQNQNLKNTQKSFLVQDWSKNQKPRKTEQRAKNEGVLAHWIIEKLVKVETLKKGELKKG